MSNNSSSDTLAKAPTKPVSPVSLLRNALARMSVITCELEVGETSVAYMVATDLELDLRASVDRLAEAA